MKLGRIVKQPKKVEVKEEVKVPEVEVPKVEEKDEKVVKRYPRSLAGGRTFTGNACEGGLYICIHAPACRRHGGYVGKLHFYVGFKFSTGFHRAGIILNLRDRVGIN